MSKKKLSAFRLVLVGPRTPGNVGACARVAANFDLTDWVIADSKCSWDNWDARMYATGTAREQLDRARAVASVDEAVRDCQIAVGFTRRLGKSRKTTVEVGEIAALAQEAGRGGRIALVFGNEETGLSTEELARCTHLCTLATSEEMRSMNLSHSVAVALARIYEQLTQKRYPQAAASTQPPPRPASGKTASMGEIRGMLDHWHEFLGDIGIDKAGNPDRMVDSLRRIFIRAHLKPREIRLIRGMLSKAQVRLGVRSRGKRVDRKQDLRLPR